MSLKYYKGLCIDVEIISVSYKDGKWVREITYNLSVTNFTPANLQEPVLFTSSLFSSFYLSCLSEKLPHLFMLLQILYLQINAATFHT